MAKTDEKAFAAVEEELRRNPSATQDELWDKAKAASPSIGRLNRRQFNARYPLQIKRRLLRESGGGAKKRAGAKKGGAKKGAKKAGARKGAGKKAAGGRKGRPAAVAAAGGAEDAPRRRGRPPGSGKKKKVGRPKGSGRKGGRLEGPRQALLGFAHDVLVAATKPHLLARIFSDIDKYVDRVTGKKR